MTEETILKVVIVGLIPLALLGVFAVWPVRKDR